MKTTLLIFLTFFSSLCFSQVAHIFSIGDDNYTITFSKNDNNYDFVLSKAEKDNPENFSLPKLDIVTFKNAIYQKLKVLDSTIIKSTEIDKTINEIFYTIIANIDTIDDLNYAPIAGTLKIANEVKVYIDCYKSILVENTTFKIKNVQIVFQQGYIQDIIVDGVITGEFFNNTNIKFTNFYGIGFTSKQNFRKLKDINLYFSKNKNPNTNFKLDDSQIEKLKKNGYECKGTGDKLANIHLNLGEVIESYDFKNGLFTTDFSPSNIKVDIEGGKSVTLYKDKTYKILEARIFSDFLGFNSDKPNGLVQIELEKQFNFNTTRYKFLTYRLRTGIGFMEYLKLNGGLTKIEENNRFLIPNMQDEQVTSYTGNQILINKRYTTPVDVLNHQTSNIGISANVIFLDMPSIKSQLHINGGFRFTQTKVQDSIRTLNTDLTINSKIKEYNLPFWQFYPEVIWHILPETRYGFYASYRPKYFYSIAEEIEFKGILNEQTGIRRENISSWINEFEILGYLYVNEEKQNGKLFIRWRLNSEMGYTKNNFSQFQVGYSFFVLGRGKQK